MTSKIKVDNISDQNDNNIINESGDVITVGAAGDTVAVAGNIVKSNALQASDGGNIVSQSGSTITLGASGDTIALSAGASQSGFGRTGTVDWDTTPKTATFTAVSGDGFFCNTTGGVFTCNLPAGSSGAIVSLADYAGTWQTNNLTVSPNGSDKIGGTNANVVLNTEGQSVTFIFVDSTQGWINVQDSTSNERAQSFVAATGGTVLTNGNFKTHIFTGPGTFCVSSAGDAGGSNSVDYLVIAGGGSAGPSISGGGGAGGFRISNSAGCIPAPTMSPLVAPASLPVSVQGYPITVGAGGSASAGGVSTFSSITSAGGGNPGGYGPVGVSGGSGGGGNASCTPNPPRAGGSGNTPPVSPPQGNNGGVSSNTNTGGGGGGAGAVGGPGGGSAAQGATGSYLADSFVGPTAPSYGTPGPVSSTRYFAGGGGGGIRTPGASPSAPTAGTGGGGYARANTTGTNGTTNTGSGGGGGDYDGTSHSGGSGGSGIVMIRYKFQ